MNLKNKIKINKFQLLLVTSSLLLFYSFSTIWYKYNSQKYLEYQNDIIEKLELKHEKSLDSLKIQQEIKSSFEDEKKLVANQILDEFKLKMSSNLDKQIASIYFENKPSRNIDALALNNAHFKYLNYQNIKTINEIDFFSAYNLSSFYDKQNKIKQMQSLALFISKEYKRPSEEAEQIVLHAAVASKKHNLPFDLVLAVIGVESSYKLQSVSNANARGLMQVIKKWHPEEIDTLNKKNINPDTIKGSIELGSMVLKKYINMSKNNLSYALQRYNGNVADSTKRYANKVLAHRSKINKVKNEQRI